MSGEHELAVWTDHFGRTLQVATIQYLSLDDQWQLSYSADWLGSRQNFALSPALPLATYGEPGPIYSSHTVKRFVENLLPEGRALDVAATSAGVGKSNIFGLIHALGAETTGAFRFLPRGVDGGPKALTPPRLVSIAELDQRIARRVQEPFSVWDNRVRMSAAGFHDKLLVFSESDPAEGGTMYLPDYPLASTYILKPEPLDTRLPHMVANEHYCMSLARALNLPVAHVSIMRTPSPVLAVARFDRTVLRDGATPSVQRTHLVDCCQVLDMPVSYKYERNIGSEGASAMYRDGVSLARLFSITDRSLTPAAHKQELTRWLLFQLAIGNCDAHGKNISFRMVGNHLSPAPWYNLVSVVQYPVNHELSMAVGDKFDLATLSPVDFGQFAADCKVPLGVLLREAQRMSKGVERVAQALVNDGPYDPEERAFVAQIAAYALASTNRIVELVRAATKLPSDIY